MIIEMLLNLVLAILEVLFFDSEQALFHVPAAFGQVIATAIGYIVDGIRIINVYIDETYIVGLLAFVIALDAVVMLYRVVMWALRKIPFLGID